MEALELDEQFLNDLELAILKRVTTLSVEQCVELGILFSSFGSTELFECFDKIVGRGIDELTSGQYIDALIAFSCAEKAVIRPKIINVLSKRVQMHLPEYSMSQLTTLAQVFFNNQTLVDNIGINEMIIDRVQSINEHELMALLALYKEDQTLKIFEVLEMKLLHELTQQNISLPTIANTFYDFTKNHTGSANLIQTLIGSVERQSATALASLDKEQQMQILLSLNMTGGS